MIKKYKLFILFLISTTFLSGLIYICAQQTLRLLANDPQIRIAEDTANQLSLGVTLQNLPLQSQVDIAKTLSPYTLIYDMQGQVLNSGVTLNGNVPHLPQGVFTYAQQEGENRITWQPQVGIRNALVIVPFHNPNLSGYVVVGRSLRETERRTDELALQVGLAWLTTLVLLFAVDVYGSKEKNPKI